MREAERILIEVISYLQTFKGRALAPYIERLRVVLKTIRDQKK